MPSGADDAEARPTPSVRPARAIAADGGRGPKAACRPHVRRAGRARVRPCRRCLPFGGGTRRARGPSRSPTDATRAPARRHTARAPASRRGAGSEDRGRTRDRPRSASEPASRRPSRRMTAPTCRPRCDRRTSRSPGADRRIRRTRPAARRTARRRSRLARRTGRRRHTGGAPVRGTSGQSPSLLPAPPRCRRRPVVRSPEPGCVRGRPLGARERDRRRAVCGRRRSRQAPSGGFVARPARRRRRRGAVARSPPGSRGESQPARRPRARSRRARRPPARRRTAPARVSRGAWPQST